MIKNLTLDAQLSDLWRRRGELGEAEWGRLYEIVTSVLQSCKPPILGGLPGEHHDYINDFFVDKVFLLDTQTHCDHGGALCSFFHRFLIDKKRTLNRRNKVERNISEYSDCDEGLDALSLIDKNGVTYSEDKLIEQALAEAGLQLTQIATSAASWLAESEEWVRLVIAHSYCQDSWGRVAISSLAKRYRIKSYAHKVQKLGFNWKNEIPRDFGHTLLGAWILSLGIQIERENMMLIHGVLKILCFQALSWAEQQDNPQ